MNYCTHMNINTACMRFIAVNKLVISVVSFCRLYILHVHEYVAMFQYNTINTISSTQITSQMNLQLIS